MRPEINRASLLGLAVACLALAGGGGAALAATTHSGAKQSGHASKAKRLTIGVKHNAEFGSIIEAGPRHLTVYAFTADRAGKSHCTGTCLKAWPPLTSATKPAVSGGVKAKLLGSIKHGKGVAQVTYKGHPLYYFKGDSAAAKATGQGLDSFGGHWWVINARGQEITKLASSAPGGGSTSSTPAPTSSTPQPGPTTTMPSPTTPSTTTTTPPTTTTTAPPVEWS